MEYNIKKKEWEGFEGRSEEKYNTEIKLGQVIDNKLTGRVDTNVRYYLSGGKQ